MQIDRNELLTECKKCQILSADKLKFLGAVLPDQFSTSYAIPMRLLTEFQLKYFVAGTFPFLKIGNYVLREKLGQGGMGRVYEAIHPRFKTVALKVCEARGRTGIKRFIREQRLISELGVHSGIVHAYDVGDAAGFTYIAMERVHGRTIQEIVDSDGPFSPKTVCEIANRIAGAMSYIHEKKIIHRDLKPSNLMVSEDQKTKVLDVGLAYSMDGGPLAHTRLTKYGSFLGTKGFVAPEQQIDARSANERSDVYSLGATMEFMLIGYSSTRQRFAGDTRLWGLISEMLDHAPENRPQTMREVRRRLAAIFNAISITRRTDVLSSISQFAKNAAILW